MKRPTAVIVSSLLLSLGGPGGASADVHVVTQIELAFDPEIVVAAPGDTIQWVWTDGFHTVTSGTDCMPDGVHFNSPLFSGMPVVEYEIPKDFLGDIPYYCAPHCTLGMVGSITVKDDTGCVEDLDGSSSVDFGDILRVLGAWGPCPPKGPCPEDVTMDGNVNFQDVLQILASWGPC